ncbi:hypothetical protein K504DRAFT_343068, partial [Pleomassaria siparia CBS 279.74]
FHKLNLVPGNAIFINSCNYTVKLAPTYSDPHRSPPPIIVAAKTQRTMPLITLPSGGVSLKVSNPPNTTVTQFEYTAMPNDVLWYNISFLDCLLTSAGKTDPTQCPGWEAGIQAVCGVTSFKCDPEEYCTTSAYFVAEYGNKPGAPVHVCKQSEGLAFEIC